jgi:hypothetical protein
LASRKRTGFVKNHKKRAMKNKILLLAILGASIGLSAQTNKSEKGTKNPKTGMTEQTYRESVVLPYPENTLVGVPQAWSLPDKVKAGFDRDHNAKGVHPVWKKDGEDYRFSFKKGSGESIGVYDKNGKLLLTERELGLTDYPSSITTYFDKNFHIKKDVIVWELNKQGSIKYFVIEKGHPIWFNKYGDHITGSEHMARHTGVHK